ncbi:MAG: AraC family transcriptional regulator [Nevskia sp.]|nr:AraC family transcriptional regulator [Nevskia sp.]
MRTAELAKPSVPISYVLLTLELAAEHGVSREALFKGMAIAPELLLQPDARMGLMQYGHLCVRALQLSREPALGYEFGLRSNLTAHGFLGFGLMCQPTLRDAVEFAVRFFTPLRLPGWDMRFFVEGSQAVAQAYETVPYGLLRQYALDMILISLVTTFRPLLPPQPDIELWFDCPEPPYYARYRSRLPAIRFGAAANQMRCPAAYLQRPIETANAVTGQLVTRECERELALLGRTDDTLQRVRAALVNEQNNYPPLEAVAKRLCMSTRTLVRRLGDHGTHYRDLLDEARHRDSLRLLEDPTLSLEVVASRLGYSSAANFSRAFRGWTGTSPGSFRDSMAAAIPA